MNEVERNKISRAQTKIKKYFKVYDEYTEKQLDLMLVKIEILSNNHVFGIAANTWFGNKILLPFMDNLEGHKLFDLITKEKDSIGNLALHDSSYDYNVLFTIFSIIKVMNYNLGDVRIYASNERPIVIKTPDLTFIIAPRFD